MPEPMQRLFLCNAGLRNSRGTPGKKVMSRIEHLVAPLITDTTTTQTSTGMAAIEGITTPTQPEIIIIAVEKIHPTGTEIGTDRLLRRRGE